MKQKKKVIKSPFVKKTKITIKNGEIIIVKPLDK